MSNTRIYRIIHQRHAAEPYSGRGGLVSESRWASKGRLVSYAAEHLALATLERIGGAGRLDRLDEMIYVCASLKETAIESVDESRLPNGWARRPPSDISRSVGDDWLEEQSSVALRVPSVMLPESWNYVLNPAHPDYPNALTPQEPARLVLDPRVRERFRDRGGE